MKYKLNKYQRPGYSGNAEWEQMVINPKGFGKHILLELSREEKITLYISYNSKDKTYRGVILEGEDELCNLKLEVKFDYLSLSDTALSNLGLTYED